MGKGVLSGSENILLSDFPRVRPVQIDLSFGPGFLTPMRPPNLWVPRRNLFRTEKWMQAENIICATAVKVLPSSSVESFWMAKRSLKAGLVLVVK